MAVAVSPGVYSQEIDLSIYTPRLSSTIFSVVGGFTKGPVNARTPIGSLDALMATFGPPTPNSQAWYACNEFLKRGNQLVVVRVGHASGGDALTQATATALTGVTNTIKFYSVNQGSGWNGYTLKFEASGSAKKLTIKDPDGIVVEVWDGILKSNVEAIVGNAATPISKFVYAENQLTGGEPDAQTVTLSGGKSGIADLSDSDIIGSAGVVKTGMKLLRNPEAVDINLVAVPGWSSPNVTLELLDLAESRGDTMALIDPPMSYDYTQVRDWHNGLIPGTSVALNSSYGALYWDWQWIYDSINGVDLQSAPSGHAARVMAYTDASRFPWYAPAGLNRGKLASSKRSNYSPDQADRDYLMKDGQNVNCIVDFVGLGSYIYGQKTLQRAPTALDRVNVRRMLLYIRKVIATAARYLVFEPNDAQTRREFVGLATPALGYVMANRGIKQYLVVCNESNNPPEVQEQSQLNGRVFVEPEKAAEKIAIDFVVTPQGTNFTEMVVPG